MVASCQSVPPAINDPATLALLPADAEVYFFANVAANKDAVSSFVGKIGGNVSSIKPALDRLDYVYGAILRAPEGASSQQSTGDAGAAFYLVGIGNFPGFLFNLSLQRSRDWKKEIVSVDGKDRAVFRQASGVLQLVLGSRGELLVSNGDIGTLLKREQAGIVQSPTIPASVVQDFSLHDIVAFIAARGTPSAPAEAGPMSIYADFNGSNIDVSSQIQTASETRAKTLAVVLRLFVINLLSQNGVTPDKAMKAVQVNAKGASVTVSGISIDIDQAAGVLSTLLKPAKSGVPGTDAL